MVTSAQNIEMKQDRRCMVASHNGSERDCVLLRRLVWHTGFAAQGHARHGFELIGAHLARRLEDLPTTNVIESSFATVRHSTVRAKGCLSNKTALAMIFKLAEAAEKLASPQMATTGCRKSSSVYSSNQTRLALS
jgi:hypothetical protein